MKILFIQYGDYAEAYRRLKSGASETYRDQRRAVDYVESLTDGHEVVVLVIRDGHSDDVLADGLRCLSVPYAELKRNWISAFLAREKPDVAVVITPHRKFLAALSARNIPTLPCFADTFTSAGVRAWLSNRALRRVLESPVFPCVANHNLNASRSVASDLHYPPERIVPWDWSRVRAEPTGKTGPHDADAPTAFFAGALTVDKGVQDCLEAVASVAAMGLNLTMSFVGPGDGAGWQDVAARLGIADRVRFLGIVPNGEVRRLMRAHDLVVVPSRHGYAEGLPNTIYEALAARSPLIVSDHPAFRGRLAVGTQCLQFPAGNAPALADAMTRLCRDRQLYAMLSSNAVQALDQIHVGIEWHSLVGHFLDDPHDGTGWVGKHALTALTGLGDGVPDNP